MEGQEGADPAGQEQASKGPAEPAGKMRFNFRTKANSVSRLPAICSSGTRLAPCTWCLNDTNLPHCACSRAGVGSSMPCWPLGSSGH